MSSKEKAPSDAVWQTVFLSGEEEPNIFQVGREDFRKDVWGICKRIGFKAQWKNGGGQFGETMGITRSWMLARDCYIIALMEGTIHFASTAVECAINLDERMQSARQKQLKKQEERNIPYPTDWLSLMPHNLREAKTYKIPVQVLLDKTESLEKDSPLIKFLERRNKIAHGDYGKYFVDAGYDLGEVGKVMSYYSDVSPKEALDQFKKCSDFLYAWVAPNPRIIGFSIEEYQKC